MKMDDTRTMNDDDAVDEDPLEFEEWDGKTPFWHHCLAGSFAGVAEHVLVYPLDTVKTHIQCATCPANPRSSSSSSSSSAMRSIQSSLLPSKSSSRTTVAASNNTSIWTTMRYIVTQPNSTTWSTSSTPVATESITKSAMGISRLWRGVHTVLLGCIPAHALYFSSYEAVKSAWTRPDGTLPYEAGWLAGAAAVLGHDAILTPLDTIKQRLQLGHYTGMQDAAIQIIKQEGALALYRSLPITLLTNLPYGSIMVSTNEVCKSYLSDVYGGHGMPPSLSICLLSSAVGGFIASFLTTPLDRIKTMLQVQELKPCERYGSCPKLSLHDERIHARQAIQFILEKEGVVGLFKGSLPRVLSHTPAVAISWTTYETAKRWLANF
jgi:solute carrier family 25 (mitochondrial iron transporter), member 28/37